MTLPAELQHRLDLAHSHLVLEDIDPAAAVHLACDLLVAGQDGPATKILAGHSARTLTAVDAQPLLADFFTELAHPAPDPRQAARLVTTDLAAKLAAGTLDANPGAHRLLGAMAETGDEPGVRELIGLLDRLADQQGRPDEQLQAEFRRFAATLAT
ncbi:hypothetical protein [Crossiella cryophila]|uniref:Uncharacterized protein n=1 Tax=Crossiella cryophila TaxID=43355 RepID=A0A7W7CDT9_9PSEU|nr:hypothetical protein [Crossiella cryophila]MBB4679289.1 hypothetical protein [Crossiella cryophila]